MVWRMVVDLMKSESEADLTPAEGEPTVRKRRKRRSDDKPRSPEEYAAQALADGAKRLDGRMMALPCVICGEFPGDCVDHTYTEPPPVLAEWAEPIMVQGQPVPLDDADQYVIAEQVWVPATLPSGAATSVLLYNPGTVIHVDEARHLGLIGDGDGPEELPIAEALGVQRPQVPINPTTFDASDVEAPGRFYLPGVPQ